MENMSFDKLLSSAMLKAEHFAQMGVLGYSGL